MSSRVGSSTDPEIDAGFFNGMHERAERPLHGFLAGRETGERELPTERGSLLEKGDLETGPVGDQCRLAGRPGHRPPRPEVRRQPQPAVSDSPSLPSPGLMRQLTGPPALTFARQPWRQEPQAMISSSRPSRIFSGKSGSARSGRPEGDHVSHPGVDHRPDAIRITETPGNHDRHRDRLAD